MMVLTIYTVCENGHEKVAWTISFWNFNTNVLLFVIGRRTVRNFTVRHDY